VPTGAVPVNQFREEQAESGEIGRSQAPFDRPVAGRQWADKSARADAAHTDQKEELLMATDDDLRLIQIKAEQATNDRLTADVNQLTVSGAVKRAPEHAYDYDGEPVCNLVLTHTIDHQESGHWELQHYHVSIHGALGQAFRATYQPDQKVIICGRLDSPTVDPNGLVPGRAWVIASDVTVLDTGPHSEDR
jgi:primosomal replication protein N